VVRGLDGGVFDGVVCAGVVTAPSFSVARSTELVGFSCAGGAAVGLSLGMVFPALVVVVRLS
jgi:hypothetical protein